MKLFLALLSALLLNGCATLKDEGMRNFRSIVPMFPDAPTKYTEGPKLHV